MGDSPALPPPSCLSTVTAHTCPQARFWGFKPVPSSRWQVLSPPSRLPSPFLWSFMEFLFPDFCLTFHSLEEKFPVSIKSKFSAFVYILVTVSVNFCPRMWKPKYSMPGARRLLTEHKASSAAPFLCPLAGSTRDARGPSIH